MEASGRVVTERIFGCGSIAVGEAILVAFVGEMAFTTEKTFGEEDRGKAFGEEDRTAIDTEWRTDTSGRWRPCKLTAGILYGFRHRWE
jgi:hypothetical protein